MDGLKNFNQFQGMLPYLEGLSPDGKFPSIGAMKDTRLVISIGSSSVLLKIPVSKHECKMVLGILLEIDKQITFEIAGSSPFSPKRKIHDILSRHIEVVEQNIQ